jgi:uncharacterized protein
MMGKLTDEQIEDVLRSNMLGRIGCSGNNRVYVVPVNYIYDNHSLICHSVPGMKIDMMRKNPEVCFEVDDMKDFTNWKSVIAWGVYEELTQAREKYSAMKLFVDRTLRLKLSETAIPPEFTEMRVHPRSPGFIKPVIYRIVLTEKTGRYERE